MTLKEMIRKYVHVCVTRRTVNIEISGDEGIVILINQWIIDILSVLKKEEVIKCIVDKKDVIVIVPHRDITIQELAVEVKKLVCEW